MTNKKLAETLTGIARPSWLRSVLNEAPQPRKAPSPPPPEEEAPPEDAPPEEASPEDASPADPAAQEPPPPDQGAAPPPEQQPPPDAAPPDDQPPVGGNQADPNEQPTPPVRPFQNDGLDKLNVDGTPKTSPNRYRQPGPGDQDAIKRYLKKNPKATDDDLHTFLRGLGIDPQEGEKTVMKLARAAREEAVAPSARGLVGLFVGEERAMRCGSVAVSIAKPIKRKKASETVEGLVGLFLNERKDLVPGGKGDKLSEKDVDPGQLRMGISVELEHTKNKALAKEIALDHLAEDPKYYSKLKKMEKGFGESLDGVAKVITDDAPEQDGVAPEESVTPDQKDPRNGDTEVGCVIVLPLPLDLARQFPRMVGQRHCDTPPHVTVLHVGELSPSDYRTMIDVVQKVVANYQPFFMDMHGADVFDDNKDYDVLYANATSRTLRAYDKGVFPTLNVLHADLRKALEDAGIDVKHDYGKNKGVKNAYAERYMPHATIAYIPKGEQCLVRPPTGSWFALDVECWGWEKIQLQLGKTVMDQPAFRR